MNWFDADQISPTGFYEFRWLATVQPAHNTPNGQPKNWIISRDRLNAARRGEKTASQFNSGRI